MDTEADEITQMVDALIGGLVRATEPLSDLVRAIYAAQTDGLIDMRAKLLFNQWPEELTDNVIMTMLTRSTGFTEALTKAIQDRRK